MKKINLSIRKGFIAIAAIGALGILSYYYFAISIPKREGELNIRGFRILARIEQNISEKKINVQRTINLFYSKSQYYSVAPTVIGGKRDSLDDKRGLIGQKQLPSGLLFDGLKISHWISKKWSGKNDGAKFRPYFDNNRNQWFLRFFGDHYSGSEQNPSDTMIVYNYEFKKFLNGILSYRKDFFQEYLILQGDEVIYQSSPFVYEGKEILKHASKKMEGKKLYSDFVQKDTLAGKQFYIFYHPFNRSSDVQFILCGLAPVEKYNQDKYLLNIEEVMWILLCFLLAALSLPFIKVLTVSKFERLEHQDIIKMGIALIAGGFITMLAIMLSAYSKAEEKRVRRELVTLNKKLEKRFLEETRQIMNEMRGHEAAIKKNNAHYKEWICQTFSNGYSDSTILSRHFNHSKSAHHTEVLLLINSAGDNWGSWLKKGYKSPDPNLSEREYVKAFLNQQEDLAPNVFGENLIAPGEGNYFIQPIYSWLDQQNLVMISKKSDLGLNGRICEYGLDSLKNNASVTAIESCMFSLTRTALPDELSFCLLDQKGNVLIHSDEKRNLRENFIDETGNQLIMKEVIANRMDTTLNVHYYGRNHLAHLSPITGVNFTLVTLYDKTYYQDALTNQVTFALSMLMLLGLVILLIFLVTHLITVRLTYLKRYKINLRWLRFTDINIRGFVQLIIFLIIPATMSCCFVGDNHLVFVSFLFPLITLALAAQAVFLAQKENYDSSYYKVRIVNQYRVFYGVCAFTTFFILVVYVYLNGFSIFTEVIGLIGAFSLLVIFLLTYHPVLLCETFERTGQYFGFSFAKKNAKLVQYFSDKKSWRPHYSIVVIFLLIVNLSIIPAANFFLVAVNQERDIARKRNSLEIGRKIDSREKWLVSNFSAFALEHERKTPSLLTSGIYTTADDSTVTLIPRRNHEPGSSLVSNPEKINKKIVRGDSTSKDDPFSKFYSAVTNLPNFDIDDYEVKGIFINRNASSDKPRRWEWKGSSDTLDYYFDPTYTPFLEKASIQIPPITNTWGNLSQGYWILYVAVILIVCVTWYSILFYLHRKITLYEYFPPDKDLDAERKADVSYLLQNIANGTTNLIVLSLPGTDVIEVIRKALIRNGYYKIKNLKDDKLTPEGIPNIMFGSLTESVRRIVVLPFFELKTTGAKSKKEPLKVLADYFQDKNIKVIWVTSSDPCEQVSILSRNALELYKMRLTNKEKPVDDIYVLEQEQAYMLKVLDDFEKVNYALEYNSENDLPPSIDFIEDEFRYGVYFKSLRENFFNQKLIETYFKQDENVKDKNGNPKWVNRFDLSEEQFVLKVQDMSQNYYYSIWSTLNAREKYVLYDFSSDELTNYKNIFILLELERKGILYFCKSEKSLKIFNKSFRNFILTVVDPDEALMLEKEVNSSGTWEIVRMVLIIFFVFLGVFLFYTEHSIFSRAVGIITAITSLFPTIVSFFANIRGTRVAK